MTHDEARAALERYYDVLTRQRRDAIATVVTDDIVFEDDGMPELVHGRAAFEALFAQVWRAFPDFSIGLVDGPFLSADGRVAARAAGGGTMRGPFPPLAPTWRRLAIEFAAIYAFDAAGRVAGARVFTNAADMAIQLGAMPPRGGRLERVGMELQHAVAWWQRRTARVRGG